MVEPLYYKQDTEVRFLVGVRNIPCPKPLQRGDRDVLGA